MFSAGIVIHMLVLVAAVLGIYFAEREPYTHIAAGAVLAATIAAVIQTIQSDRDVEFVRQTLSHLARSVPPSWQWKERVRANVQKTGATKDYRLYKALYDKANYRHDPDARAIFLFKPLRSGSNEPNGVLVLSRNDYSDLSILDRRTFETKIRQLMFSPWETTVGGADPAAAFGDQVLEIASSLYALLRIGKGFPVSVRSAQGQAPLIVECGDLRVTLDGSTIESLLQKPRVEGTLRVAEMIAKLDPEISTYVR